MAPSSSGLGRRPLKAEVEGSNPFGATMNFQPPFGAVFVSSHDFVPALFFFSVPVRSRFGWDSGLRLGRFLCYRCGRSPLFAFAAKHPCGVGV